MISLEEKRPCVNFFIHNTPFSPLSCTRASSPFPDQGPKGRLLVRFLVDLPRAPTLLEGHSEFLLSEYGVKRTNILTNVYLHVNSRCYLISLYCMSMVL